MLPITPKPNQETALKTLVNKLAAAVRAAEKRKAVDDQYQRSREQGRLP